MELLTSTRLIDRHFVIRALEIIPGVVTWLTLLLPITLSLISPIAVAYFIIAFDLYWMFKSFHISFNLYRAHRRLQDAQLVDWNKRLEWLSYPQASLEDHTQKLNSYIANHPGALGLFGFSLFKQRQALRRLTQEQAILENIANHEALIIDPKNIYNVVIIATYNESVDVLRPSVTALSKADYPMDRLMVVIAYEERGGEETKNNALTLVDEFKGIFHYITAVMHPDGLIGEHRGKGANISYAGRALEEYIVSAGIDPENVIVTSLDSDHRPSKNYFSLLTYEYASDPNRLHHSYQPIPIFFNNIWDVPAPMRVIATGNSFWTLTETMRPNRLRNFAAHAQGLATLIRTDFWSVTTIVEDGHQYWRTYFAFNGDHQVIPVYTSVYQDAVLASSYLKTFKVQYLQLRRWAWGCSDIPFVIRNMVKNPEIPLSNRLVQFGRLFEAHFSQATAPLILTFVAYLPLVLNPHASTSILAQNLPYITSRILTVASIGIIFMVFFSMISLPPRPARHKRIKTLGMMAQWVLLPFTTMFFGSFAAIDAQTRLMLGLPLEFYVTDKVVKK